MTLHDLVVPGFAARTELYFRIPEIRAADPLGADAPLARLPAMNAAADVPALAAVLRALLPEPEDVARYDVPRALAAMRDLGMLLGSLKRHGAEPVTAVPYALPVLERLGRITDMVPRDTVHHYTTWNPPGERLRTYTGLTAEARLQDAVRMVIPGLVTALDHCAELAGLEPYDPGFATALDRTADALGAMVDSIDFTIAHVPPVVFATDIRPYFEEIDVDGVDYLGPAAAQVPLWLVDLTLWQSDRGDRPYERFLAESVRYTLPGWRAHYTAHRGGTSAVSKFSAAVSWETAGGRPPAHLVRSGYSLVRVLRILKAFRARHITVARKAYAEEVRLYEQGSGGAPIELLRAVLDLTRDNETFVRRAVEPARAGGRARHDVCGAGETRRACGGNDGPGGPGGYDGRDGRDGRSRSVGRAGTGEAGETEQ
ncbi:monodechloroaminopyrrolnitrin synthase PrnB family protein [Streptomyces qinzhouensis]|uniref:monodechloroaminopyrrolnitrin synthase PrnB family protein n=1 Tax=Streptomyces qinzhouensis TaxID=2599401 RepID=UPI001FE96367|nr:monodechloroaminopyrrolnitrin synthase PrnB family protein [Streptomyces qinzhouensis]